jgi:transposase
LVVDALGLPLVFEITEGQRHDSRPASALVRRARSSCILADKGYDSDAFRAALDCQGCLPVIPSNGSRAGKLPYDKQLYKSRSEIECTFNYSSRPGASLLVMKRPSATTRRWLLSAVRCSGCGSEPYSSQLCANLISIDTMRTSMPLAALCPASSKSLSRWQTSSSAADSVADPLAVT